MNLSDFSFNIFLDTVYLLRSSERLSAKIRILGTYARLNIKSILLCKAFRVRLRKEKFLNFRVSFFNYDTFYLMFREIFLRHEYSFKSEKKNPVILDCGSNIGMATLFFKFCYPKSEIFCFEPDKNAFSLLKKNIEHNRLLNVHTDNVALSNREGFIDLYIDDESSGSLLMSTEPARLHNNKIAVRSALLSSYIKEPVDFMKMDIEGSEEVVIEELHNKGKLRLIKEMVIEYHHFNYTGKKRSKLSNLLKILEDNGFNYQISSLLIRISRRHKFQDILIYAYQE
ncbi:MAG: FkbM family methyltransferase [Candidatus Aminicenantaceae bacterium]